MRFASALVLALMSLVGLTVPAASAACASDICVYPAPGTHPGVCEHGVPGLYPDQCVDYYAPNGVCAWTATPTGSPSDQGTSTCAGAGGVCQKTWAAGGIETSYSCLVLVNSRGELLCVLYVSNDAGTTYVACA